MKQIDSNHVEFILPYDYPYMSFTAAIKDIRLLVNEIHVAKEQTL